MAERFAFLYERATPFTAQELLRMLVPAGLQFVHPSTGKITLLDAIGDQVTVTAADLEARLSNESDLSFQLWLSDDDDVYGRTRLYGETRVLELSMEGTRVEQRARIGQALRDWVLTSAERSQGLVFDPEGVSADYRWHDFFVSRLPLDAADPCLHGKWPTAVVLPLAELQRVNALPESCGRSQHDQLVVLSNDASWLAVVGST